MKKFHAILIIAMILGLMLSLSACRGNTTFNETEVNHMEVASLPKDEFENQSVNIYENVCDIDALNFSDLQDSFVAVSLVLDGNEICRQADNEKISLIADMMENARKLGYEPQTHNIDDDFLLVFEA